MPKVHVSEREAQSIRIAGIVENLYCDNVNATPRDVDWSEGWPEAWEFYESVECDGSYDDETIPSHYTDGLGYCQHEGCPRYGEEDESGSREGPMMNYYYPLDSESTFGTRIDPQEAAQKIADLPLCIVTLTDSGETGLALTGGGMDLSWEICAAYIALGFLPPVHFCDLPRMGKRDTESNRLIVAACRRSCDVAASWAESKSSRLDNVLEPAPERS